MSFTDDQANVLVILYHSGIGLPTREIARHLNDHRHSPAERHVTEARAAGLIATAKEPRPAKAPSLHYLTPAGGLAARELALQPEGQVLIDRLNQDLWDALEIIRDSMPNRQQLVGLDGHLTARDEDLLVRLTDGPQEESALLADLRRLGHRTTASAGSLNKLHRAGHLSVVDLSWLGHPGNASARWELISSPQIAEIVGARRAEWEELGDPAPPDPTMRPPGRWIPLSGDRAIQPVEAGMFVALGGARIWTRPGTLVAALRPINGRQPLSAQALAQPFIDESLIVQDGRHPFAVYGLNDQGRSIRDEIDASAFGPWLNSVLEDASSLQRPTSPGWPSAVRPRGRQG